MRAARKLSLTTSTPEIAEIVAFFASDRASFIVGSVVMADGGMSVLIKLIRPGAAIPDLAGSSTWRGAVYARTDQGP
jgi:hypothetical protein